MHPANHGIKHKFIMEDGEVALDSSNNQIVGYLTFDTQNIVLFDVYGNDRGDSIYSPLTLRYKEKRIFPTKTKMLNAIIYKTYRFVLVY